MSNAYITIGHRTFFAKQNRKRKKKQLTICLKSEFVLIFELPVNRRFYVQEADVLVRERLRTTEFIQFCEKGKQNSYVKRIIPLGSTLLSPLYLRASHHSAAQLTMKLTDRCRLNLMFATGFWMQGDPMRHSITL